MPECEGGKEQGKRGQFFTTLARAKSGVFTVANMSLREAVKTFDVSRPTLQKALKSGRVSGVQDDNGHWHVDRAELSRVFVLRSTEAGKPLEGKLPTMNRGLPGNDDAMIAALRAELAEERIRREAAEALAQARGRHIDDLQRMLPAPERTAQRKRWWPW